MRASISIFRIQFRFSLIIINRRVSSSILKERTILTTNVERRRASEKRGLVLEATEVFYGKTKVVGLVELSMPAPLHYAHYDGISMH